MAYLPLGKRKGKIFRLAGVRSGTAANCGLLELVNILTGSVNSVSAIQVCVT
jgi:hypothetical protein